ncbi:translation initiation factor IF-2, partial [Bacillus cereus]|uniref:translation initiation factor IF-2 N-terminal domain-containing protein n=1 Tax=Bacillus cereus TaxID=1396 RepID=UPI000BED3430
MSDKKRINQIAKETGLTNAELVSAAQTLGFEVKSHSSSLTAEQAEKIIQSAKTGTDQTAKVAEKPVKKSQPKAAESAKKNKEDHPRTFAGKAVVEDPAILARIKAKE